MHNLLANSTFYRKSVSLAVFLMIAAGGHFLAFKIVHVPAQLEMVVLFSLLAFYPVIRYPAVGIYLLFIIMPFIPFLRRLYYLQYIRPTNDPLIATGDIIITLLIVGLFFEFRDRKEYKDTSWIISRCILIYFLYLVIRTFFLNILPLDVAIMRFRFYGPSVLLFFVGTLFAGNTKLLKNIWMITIAIGVAGSLYGIKQLLFGYYEFERLWYSSISFTTLFIKGIARPFSFFQSPAAFADYMQLSIIGIIVLMGWNRCKRYYILLALIPIYFYGALITSVRSNWIGIVVTFCIWIFILQFRTIRSRIIMIGVLALFFALTQYFEAAISSGLSIDILLDVLGGNNQYYMDLLVTERAGAISNPFEEYSLLSRITLWKFLISLSREPVMALFGRGVGALNADSLYITYLAEFGYPGALFIVSLVIFLIARGFSLLDSSSRPEVVSLAKGITIMNIVFAVINITGTHIHSFPGDAYFWFWNGVLIKLSLPQKGDSPIDIYENTVHS